MPRTSSIQKEALAALKRGETLTPLDALSRWGITRLASIIHRLRRAGHKIETVRHPTLHGARYAEYRLPRT